MKAIAGCGMLPETEFAKNIMLSVVAIAKAVARGAWSRVLRGTGRPNGGGSRPPKTETTFPGTLDFIPLIKRGHLECYQDNTELV